MRGAQFYAVHLQASVGIIPADAGSTLNVLRII